MALLSNFSFFGFVVSGVTTRVHCPAISENKKEIIFYVASEKDGKSLEIVPRQFQCEYLMGANPFEVAYAHLKTLPELAGAVDV
jgi:hypothetical protein